MQRIIDEANERYEVDVKALKDQIRRVINFTDIERKVYIQINESSKKEI